MIQIDIPMPERCSRCPFVNVVIQPPRMEIHCTILKTQFDVDFMEKNQRHPECPLMEVEGER